MGFSVHLRAKEKALHFCKAFILIIHFHLNIWQVAHKLNKI